MNSSNGLGPVFAFAHRWQRRPWSIATLPVELGASLAIRESSHDMLGVAACAYRRGAWSYAISINAAIVGTTLYLPILAHESAHCLLRHILGLCDNAWVVRRMEREAWLGASALAVSRAQALAVRSARMTACEVATQSGLPVELVRLRLALGVTERESEALAAWQTYLKRAVPALGPGMEGKCASC